MVVSDWNSVGELIPHGIANDGGTAARKALAAGVDMDMESNLYHEYLLEQVKSGKLREAQIDEAVRRVLRVKFALGLFENPYTDEKRENRGPLAKENLEAARAAAERSFVLLLKNELLGSRRVLPLSNDGQSVALIGPLADDAGEMLGSWGAHGQAKDVVTLKSALTQRLGAGHVKYAKGGEILTATDEQIGEAVAAAREADVAVLALGRRAGNDGGGGFPSAPGFAGTAGGTAGEGGGDRKPVVLVLFSGRPLTLTWAFGHVPAVLEVWSPGVQAGPAIVRSHASHPSSECGQGRRSPHAARWRNLVPHGLDSPGRAMHRDRSELLPYVPDLRKDKFHLWISKWHAIPSIVIAVVFYFIGGWPWVMWGVFLRTVVSLHATWLVNSATHMWGSQRFATGDLSRNSFWVADLTFGEGWPITTTTPRNRRVTASSGMSST